MKALIFLILVALVVSVVVWRSRKSQAEADLARRKALKRRREQAKETLTPENDMVWPVIIRPVTGKQSAEEKTANEELSMTAIAFEPAEQSPARQRGSTKAAS